MGVAKEVCTIEELKTENNHGTKLSLDKASFVDICTEDYARVVENLYFNFQSGQSLTYKFRIEQLKNLQRMLKDNWEDFITVLGKDLRKPRMEAIGELVAVDAEISEAIQYLQKWMSPTPVPANLLFPGYRAFTKSDPFGVVLIIGTWNYPVVLSLQPLVGAIAAGNCVLLKPSEISMFTSAKISELLPKYLDPKFFCVIEGGVSSTTVLLKERFDYIFCTSSTRVGQHVMLAASKNLTPVTLELGGKSPVYIHDSADLQLSLKRILWGKITNMGQTCISPDFIICSRKVQDYFVNNVKSVLDEWYGQDMKGSKDIGRIINHNHFNRLQNLIRGTSGKIEIGGNTDPQDLWIDLTFVVDVDDQDILMEDEIFGPILPFINAESEWDALNYINTRKSKPLALYLFSGDKKVNKLFLEKTSSGALSINEVILHCGWKGLPFGGVQDSGMGSYHGKYSFDTFSHRKAVLARDFSKIAEKLTAIRYPPYKNADTKMKFVSAVLRYQNWFRVPSLITLSYLLIFVLGLVALSLILIK